jgi:hypothetical protein
VQALYHLTRTLDPTRPVIGNDGWEHVATDIVGIHDYDQDPNRLARRYAAREAIPHLLSRERPGGRLISLTDGGDVDRPVVLSEFGGIAFSTDPQGWGYARSGSAERFAASYRELLETVRSLPLLAGFCYTQFSDTYQETNGLLYADRTPKFPLEEIAQATRGPRTERQVELERAWERRMRRAGREIGADPLGGDPPAPA